MNARAPYQYFFYTPFGETILQEDAFTASYDNPWRFNGKELDAETGNYYYGARYYNPKWSVWLSVDPWANKYPYISPFNFVENNPIRLIDPDGNGPGDVLIVFSGGKVRSSQSFDFSGQEPMQELARTIALGFSCDGGSVTYCTAPLVTYMDGLSHDRLNELTEVAFNFIVENLGKENGENVDGSKLVIAGFSYGGVLATHLTERLEEEGICTDYLVLLDAAYGQSSDEVQREINGSVSKVDNYFQTNGDIFSEDNSIGSRGFPVTRFDGSNFGINNIRREEGHEMIDNQCIPQVINTISEEFGL